MTIDIQALDPLEIETTAGTQGRASISQKVVDEYAEDMRNGALFPSLVVFAEKGSKRYVLADGFHRLQAHLAAHKTKAVQCDVREGTIFDAKVYSAGANGDHGVRRRAKDIRHAVKMLLMDGHSDGWADTVVADMAKCHRKTVAKVREDLIVKGELDTPKTKKHKQDGKTVEKPVTEPKGTSKKRNKEKDKVVTAPTRSQEDYDREEIVSAIATLNGVVCSGSEALEKYKLHDQLSNAEKAADWLDDLISSSQEVSDDDAAFLEVV